jgi:hypothetical protein
MSRIRKGAVAAVVGAMSLVGAAPVHASPQPVAPCQFLMPIYPEEVTYCACVTVGRVVIIVLPDSCSCAPPR